MQDEMSGLARPQAILFDWDNTLVDTWVVIHHALEITFRTMDREPWTLEETRQRVRASARDAFPAIFGEQAEEAMVVFYRSFEADHLVKLKPLPGAAAMISALAARDDLVIAVVSNKQGRLLRRESKHLGWSQFFYSLVGANDAVKDKPHRAVVDMALEGSGVEAGEQVWFVGDTDIDMDCAGESGCLPVLVRPEAPAQDEFPLVKPALHLPNCESLLHFFNRLS